MSGFFIIFTYQSKLNHMKKALANSFRDTRRFLNQIAFINQGGCGVAALALYDAAVRDGKNPKIVYLYSPFFDYGSQQINEKFKQGKVKRAAPASHVVLKVGRNYWDSDGIIPAARISFYQKDDTITREHLISSINNRGAWNTTFNRKYWIPKIKAYFNTRTRIVA